MRSHTRGDARSHCPLPAPPNRPTTHARDASGGAHAQACKHGEVERIAPLLDGDALSAADGTAAIRYQSVIGAAAAVDSIDGRFFAERALAATFDDGRASRVLPAGEDLGRQQRFGFGEIAQAYQDSMRVLRLAAAEGAPFVACAQYICEVEHYAYHPDGV